MNALAKRPWVAPLVALVVVYAVFAIASPDTFARADNLVTMTRQTLVVAVAAVGTTVVIASGGIDLSIGSSVALTTVVVARLLRGGSGPFAAAFAGIAVAALAGSLVGVLVTRLRVTPFIVTLGAMTVLRGLAKGLAHEQKIDVDPHGLDLLVARLPPSRALLLFPPGVYLLLLAAAAVAFVLRSTRFGRHLLAVGSNEGTARLAGVDVRAIKVAVYALCGALTGLAGVLEFATLTVGDPTDSVGLELTVIAAVVIGGGSLLGGEASIAGSLTGAFLMTVITTGCTHVGFPNWVEEILAGVIIVVAVALDHVRKRRRSAT